VLGPLRHDWSALAVSSCLFITVHPPIFENFTVIQNLTPLPLKYAAVHGVRRPHGFQGGYNVLTVLTINPASRGRSSRSGIVANVTRNTLWRNVSAAPDLTKRVQATSAWDRQPSGPCGERTVTRTLYTSPVGISQVETYLYNVSGTTVMQCDNIGVSMGALHLRISQVIFNSIIITTYEHV